MPSLVLINQRIRRCTACPLSETRWRAVPGSGSPTAEIVFLGEAPGENEDTEGEPFVGRAGKLLDSILAEVGLTRAEVYLLNCLKCRPPKNRDPHASELDTCEPWLDLQLEAIGPKLVIGLGNYSISYLFPGLEPKQARGAFRNNGSYLATATYHPAAVLRGRPKLRERIVEDIRRGIRYAGCNSSGEEQ